MGEERASSSSSSLMATMEEEMTLTVKWSGKEYTVRVCGDDTVGELKRRICQVTEVLPKRQKLLYPKIVGPKLADDSTLISQLPFKSSVKMTMIGTVEDDLIIDPVDSPEIVDDFELGQDEAVDLKDKEVNKQKLRRRIDQYKIKVRNPCRKGKKLLVLDIDYTLFDHRSTAENPLQLMRPYLHDFLTAAYAEYDIMIWSATSMKWVELKMGQLGVLNNPNYKITALLDHLAMITVQSESRGVFDCKPLGLIWAHFPEYYNSTNTIMFDDLRRNFVMNPQNGLTIRPFRKAHANRENDKELVKLTQYLLSIAEGGDLSALDHRSWESFVEDSSKRRRRV
ncbi:ubiquitin-like domain-containing CTD phosphatase [Chenopodium quinoa]|uniref:ubiquitin-like domain-containing CTD phosphatase n=1 Tax=Chenopodium quinoa TaxID=63459 RepID=UPI000B777277|nr:ubiquitin-like domain-containing CTD phosphatase [Chenopodium quinoa]